MYAGYLVERGAAGDIFDKPHHPYTHGLLASLPRLDKEPGSKLTSIPGNPPSLIDLPPGCPFAPRCTFAVDKCRTEMPSLEEVDEGHTVACWEWKKVVSNNK